MRRMLPVIFALTSTAAGAHESAHLHPHDPNGWALGIVLPGVGLAGGGLIGRVQK